jgi:hypothetical protein
VAVVEPFQGAGRGRRRRWTTVGWEGSLLLAGALAAGFFAAVATRGFHAPRGLGSAVPGPAVHAGAAGDGGRQPLK